MKKKIVSLALVVCLLAVAIVGGSLAYFTDYEADKNVMTMGNIDIVQNEYQCSYDDEGNFVELVPFNPTQPLLPMGNAPAWEDPSIEYDGDEFLVFASDNAMDKIVTVTNNGNADAYVRTIVAVEAGKSEEEADDLWYHNIAVYDNTSATETAVTCIDNDMYVKIGDTYYIILIYTYTEALAAGDESEASLTGVALYSNTTKEDMASFDGDFEVLVLSQAVQAADMGSDPAAALDAAFGEVNATNVAAWFASIA